MMANNYQNIDESLLLAYKNTDYRLKNTRISIKIDEINPLLDEFLIDNNAYSWIFISADNPQSQLVSEKENLQKRTELLHFCKNNHYRYWPGQGIPATDDWPIEESLLVLDLGEDEILELMRRFEQKAVVMGALGREAEVFEYPTGNFQ